MFASVSPYTPYKVYLSFLERPRTAGAPHTPVVCNSTALRDSTLVARITSVSAISRAVGHPSFHRRASRARVPVTSSRPARRALPSGQGTQALCLQVLVWATTSTAAAPLPPLRCKRVAAGKLCGAAVMSCHAICGTSLPSRLRTVESTVHNTYFDYFSSPTLSYYSVLRLAASFVL